MIKLYGISGSRALRSLWAAEEIGLEYEHVPVHFAGDSKKPEYLAINPNGRVPALVDGDLVLFESQAINLYLARRYGGALWPEGEDDQARAIQWSFWGMTEIEPPIMTAFLNRVMLPEAQRDAAAADQAEKQIARPLDVLEKHLEGRNSLLGDAFTIADLNLAGVLSMSAMGKIDLSGWPNVTRWLGACTSRPSFAKARSL